MNKFNKLFFLIMFYFIISISLLSIKVYAEENSPVNYEDKYYVEQVKKLKGVNPPGVPGLKEYTLFQLGFWKDTPIENEYSNVFGLKVGIPMSSGYGRVFGLESSLLASTTDYIKGVQGAFVNVSKKIDGAQIGFVNVSEKVLGVQIGFVNVSYSTGCQIGFINVIEGAWLPCWPFCNVSF